MKLKYYLRGAGIGIVFATLIMILACSLHKNDLSREEIIKEASKLGMVMPESESENLNNKNSEEDSSTLEQEESQDSATSTPATEETEQEGESEETQQPVEPEAPPVSEEPATISITIQAGWVSRNVADALYENGLITDAEAFRKLLGETGVGYQLEVGVYTFPVGATEQQILDILRAGDGMD